MNDTILDEWFTKSQAAAFLQVSEKTVERLARKGEIRREMRKRPGVRPSPVYSPEDLDRVKTAQVPQVVVMPPPGGGRWCSRTRSPRGSSLVPAIARHRRGRAAEGQVVSQPSKRPFDSPGFPNPRSGACSGAGSSPASKREGGGFAGWTSKNWVVDNLKTCRTRCL